MKAVLSGPAHCRMLLEIARKIWRLIPFRMRLLIVRSTQNKFTVSVVALIVSSDKKVLLLDHYIRPGSSWGLPGGFVEPGELPAEAIRREISEETGIELGKVELIEVRTIRKHVEILFMAKADGPAEIRSREIRDLGWFSPDDLPDEMNVKQKELVRKLTS